MSATFKIALAALAISAAVSTAGAPAAFADKPETLSFRIAYGDLDMSHPASGAKLLNRIEKAARKVCTNAIPGSPLFQRKAIECRNETVANTVRSLDFATLSVAWNGKYAATQVAAR
jgi:UrcA family protein